MTTTTKMTTTTTGPPALLLLLFASACTQSDDGDSLGDGSTAVSADASGSGDDTAASTNATSGADTSDADASTAGSASTDEDSTSDSGGAAVEGVELGMAGEFAILAKSGISDVPPSAITGDIGVSPAAATFITGFSLIADATNVFATSEQVTGRVYAADYEPPTPSTMTTAIADMELAFTDAAGRAPDVTELGAGNIGGMTLAPGVYKWGTGLLIPTDVTLEGSATDVWIFQIAEDLTVATGTSVVLSGGALPENVYWQVAGLVELGSTAHAEGVVLTQTSITLGTGASIDGRLLAQTAVSLDGNAVVAP